MAIAVAASMGRGERSAHGARIGLLPLLVVVAPAGALFGRPSIRAPSLLSGGDRAWPSPSPASSSSTRSSVPAPFGASFTGVLGGELAAQSTFGPPRRLEDGQPLPPSSACLISSSDRLILSFMLAYISEQEAAGALRGVDLHISGGYVRDLLLGRPSDDLDLSLCLRDCPPDVTVDRIAAELPAFAVRRPELAVENVEVVTAFSNAAQSKSIDAAQVRMRVAGAAYLVDLMPTIGEETYDDADRIPKRDGRGTAEQDALRRDLTIGAMLLRVAVPPGSARASAAPPLRAPPTAEDSTPLPSLPSPPPPPPPPPPSVAPPPPSVAPSSGLPAELSAEVELRHLDLAVCAASDAASLHFHLLDPYGGLADLRDRLLRAPVPRDRGLEEVFAEVLPTAELRQRAAAAGLAPSKWPRAWMWPSADAGATDGRLQTLWWIKMLRDDPLRLVRTLRFSATLGFRVHPSFWSAVPFAVEALRFKVSGARKLAELRKIAGSGARAALLDFFELAFTPLADFGDDVPFGDALFGGTHARARAFQ